MPISPGPIVPNIVDRPATFEPEAEAWTDWLANEHRAQLNALEANVNAKEASTAANAAAAASRAATAQGSATTAATQASAAAASAASALAAPGTSATSATSLTPGSGSKVFTTQAGKAFAAGQTVVARSATEPRQFMVGTVASYAGTTLTVTVTAFGQAPAAGASADWNITFWGAVPAAVKPGQVLRLNGSTPEWGDEGGRAVQILSAENLLYDSQDAAGAYWNGGVLATANVDIAPDGTKTADLIAGNRSQGKMLPADGIYTYSRYYKQQADTYVIHRLFDAAGSTYLDTVLDFLTGQLSLASSNESILRSSDAAVGAERLGNGWWRVWITAPCAGVLYAASDSATGSLAWGAQLRRGRSPGLYVPTTNATASGAGPSKRNYLPYSRPIETVGGPWELEANTARIGKTLSPAGDLSATVYEATGSTLASVRTFFAAEANTQYTFSCWARIVSGSVAPGAVLAGAVYDANGDGSADTLAQAVATGLGEAWRRFSATFVQASAGTIALLPGAAWSPGTKLAFWGAQLEKGPSASNLIDSGATATDGQHADIELRRTHLVDTTHAAVDIAPPADMQLGDWFEVVDVGKRASVNPITVLPGGVGRIDGAAEPFVIDVDGWSARFTFDSEKGLVIS